MILGSGLLQSSWPRASDWLIRDEFTDTVAAGSVNGTAATPGPGTRTVTDTESKLSVGSGVLALAGGKASPTAGDPGLWYGAQDHADGIAVVAAITLTGDIMHIGFDSDTAENTNVSAVGLNTHSPGYLTAYGPPGLNVFLDGFSAGTEYKFAVVQSSSKNHIFARGGNFPSWTLLWTRPQTATATVYPGISSYSAIANIDYLRVLQLPAPFDTDDGIATDVHSGSVAAGTTFTHEADFVMEFTVDTLPSSGNIWVFSRVADSNNFWWLVIGSTGTFLLYEKNAGVLTERARANNVVANGHRIVVVAEGTTIKAYYNNTLAWSYAGAANAATATSGELDALATGGAVSDLITWPRTLGATAATAQAASILNKVSA